MPTLTRLSFRAGTRDTVDGGLAVPPRPPAAAGVRCATLRPRQTLSLRLPGRLSTPSVRGRTTSHPANSRNPASRSSSRPYVVCPGSTAPPPPKHPQSIDSPRAHACATPAMNPSRSTADDDGHRPGGDAGEQEQADHDLQPGQYPGDEATAELRQHVVGADGDVGGVGVDRLEHPRDEEDRGEPEARDGPDDVPDPRRPHTTSLATSGADPAASPGRRPPTASHLPCRRTPRTTIAPRTAGAAAPHGVRRPGMACDRSREHVHREPPVLPARHTPTEASHSHPDQHTRPQQVRQPHPLCDGPLGVRWQARRCDRARRLGARPPRTTCRPRRPQNTSRPDSCSSTASRSASRRIDATARAVRLFAASSSRCRCTQAQ